MDQLPPLGRNIPQLIVPCYKIYGGLLSEVANQIHQTQRQEFSYGSDSRQKLDIYSPAIESSTGRPAADGRPRVLIFLYGGGFVSGDKRLAGIPGDLAYTNLGHFFAHNYGFHTVIMDYRLISHGAKYPSGAEDLDLCLQWVTKKFGSQIDISILGNSAGAAHTAFWLFGEKWSERRQQLVQGTEGPTIRKVGLLGCPFRFDPEGGMKDMLQAYFGEPETTKMAEPTSLMLQAVKARSQTDVAKQWPDTRVIISELDPENIIHEGQEFAALWAEKGGEGHWVHIKGHNHISPVLALGTGISNEEEWGHHLAQWFLET